jgi:hypothetical protein
MGDLYPADTVRASGVPDVDLSVPAAGYELLRVLRMVHNAKDCRRNRCVTNSPMLPEVNTHATGSKFLKGDSMGFFFIYFVLYSALLHLPSLRFHCADGCWDRIQYRCNWCIDSQTL